MPIDKPIRSLSQMWDDYKTSPTAYVAALERLAFYRGASSALYCLHRNIPLKQLTGEIREALADIEIDFQLEQEDRETQDLWMRVAVLIDGNPDASNADIVVLMANEGQTVNETEVAEVRQFLNDRFTKRTEQKK